MTFDTFPKVEVERKAHFSQTPPCVIVNFAAIEVDPNPTHTRSLAGVSRFAPAHDSRLIAHSPDYLMRYMYIRPCIHTLFPYVAYALVPL